MRRLFSSRGACMLGIPIPSNEELRLRELQKLRSREWGMSVALNELCAVASMTLGTAIASVSLVFDTELHFCGKIGLNADRTSRESAFCAHTIMSSAPFVVEDADNDPRFADNPNVSCCRGIKAYAGIPLETSPGVCIGAFCVMERKPRSFDATDMSTLKLLSQIAMAIINGHRMTLELDDQLQSAIALQKDMLPNAERISQVRSRVPLDISSYYKPLEGIGGDIWNVEATGPQRVLLYMADFMGHGVAAALNTARFHSFVHIISQRTDDPASLLTRLNKRLHEVLPDGQFATMFCATIDFKSRSLDYATAGAPPMVYRRSGGDPFEILCRPSLPLGIVGDSTYASETVPFLDGGSLVLYTDGLIETPKPPHEIFSAASLKDYIARHNGGSSQALCDSIVDRLLSEAGGMANDDMTLVVVKHTGGVFDAVIDYQV